MNQMNVVSPVALMLSIFLLTGCGSDTSDSKPNVSKPSASKPKNEEANGLTWKPCIFPEEIQVAEVSGVIECSQVPVPLNWDDTNSQKINYTTIRVRSANPAKGKIWLLDGGPGGSGLAYLEPSYLSFFDPENWDIYIPMHRGTGDSSPLTCSAYASEEEDSLRNCFLELQKRYGSDLQYFNTYGAAKDLGKIIEMESTPSDKVIVFGGSYGTYWAQRYLQFYSYQADAVILDGVLDLDSDVARAPIRQDDVGSTLLELCDQDMKCSNELGQPAEQLLRTIYARSGVERCSILETQEDTDEVKAIFSALLPEGSNILIPPVIKMLDRCEQGDIDILQQLMVTINGLNDEEQKDEAKNQVASTAMNAAGDVIDLSSATDFNNLLSDNVIYTEIFRPIKNADELEAESSNLLFAAQTEVRDRFEIESIWQVPKSPVNTELGNINIPVLILQGELDPQTFPIWAEWTKAKLPGLNQHLVMFPYSKHGVPEDSLLIDGSSCGAHVMQQFMDDPYGDLDQSCIAQTLKPDFGFEREISQETAQQMLNVRDPWSLLATD